MHILRLIDTMKLSLIVEGHEISSAAIEKDYQVKVSFELVDPVIQFQARELGLREVQAGVKSKDTYWSAAARSSALPILTPNTRSAAMNGSLKTARP